MDNDYEVPKRPPEDIWPLVVALCIATPLVVWLAYAMARAAETGEVRPALGLVLVITMIIGGAVVVYSLFSEPINTVVRVVVSLARRATRMSWSQPGVSHDHVDALSSLDAPQEASEGAGPREFSPGPGLSLLRRFRKPPPVAKRRI